MLKKKTIDNALISALLVLLTAGIARLFVDTDSAWYLSLVKPSFQPPDWAFIVAWSVIYLLFGVSFYFARQNGADKKTYVLYFSQAALNILWCLFYFTLHMLYSGLAIIIFYLVATYLTIRDTYAKTKLGALLLLPQAVWLILAAALNYATILLN